MNTLYAVLTWFDRLPVLTVPRWIAWFSFWLVLGMVMFW